MFGYRCVLWHKHKKRPSSISDVIPSLWPWQDSVPHHFNLNDLGLPVTDLNTPSMAPVSIHRDGGPLDNTVLIWITLVIISLFVSDILVITLIDYHLSMQVVLTCFKSMTWIISNKNSSSSSKIAVINMKVCI